MLPAIVVLIVAINFQALKMTPLNFFTTMGFENNQIFTFEALKILNNGSLSVTLKISIQQCTTITADRHTEEHFDLYYIDCVCVCPHDCCTLLY